MAEHLSDEDVGLSSGPPAGHLSDKDVGLLSDADVGLEAPQPSYTDRINQVAQATQIIGAITNPAKGMGMLMHAATQAIGGALDTAFPSYKESVEKTKEMQRQFLPAGVVDVLNLPSQDLGSVIETSLSLLGGGPAKMPGIEPAISPGAIKALAPAVEDFITNVMAPAAERMVTSEAEKIAVPREAAPAAGEGTPEAGAVPEAPAVPPLFKLVQEAKDFGVVGPEKPQPPPDMPPAKVAQQAIPAARTPDDKLTMTPNGEPINAWEARFKDWVSRVKEPEDVKPFIEKAAQENNNFPEARAGEVPPDHVKLVAEAAGVKPGAIDGTELSAKFNTPDKIRMVKQALDTTLQDFKTAKSLVEDDPSIENIGKMLEAEIRRDYTVEYVVGLRSEWARTGHALRDLLEAGEKEPSTGMAEGLKGQEGKTREQVINDLLASKGRTPADMANLARSTRGLSDADMAKVLTNMRGKGPHWLHWAVSQALISGVITHTFYTGTNLMFMELERVVAPTVAAIFDRIRGNPDPILFGEIGASQRALISSIPQAWDAAKQAFQTGLRVPLPRELELLAKEAKGPKAVEKAMVPYTSGQEVNWGIMRRIASDSTLAKVERYGGLPGRSANFQHTFFKNLSFHASMDAQAYRAAAKEGLNPKSQEFADRQAFWKANPTDEMIEKGVQDGYSGTFMEELGEKTAAFSRMVRDTPLQWVFFFTHIPMNIARAGVRYTAPFLGKEMRADMMGENGQSKQNLAYAKWTLGSTFASYFVYKGMMDEATGSYPTDPEEQRRWRLEGRQQNSIKALGQWWSLERLGPPGIAAKLGADIGYVARNWDHEDKGLGENITNAMGHLAVAFGNAYGTEAGFQGVSNLMDLLQGKRTPAEWAAYQGASFVQPISMLSQAASFMDPNMRQAKTLIDGIKMRLPILRQTLQPKRDPLFGDPVPNPGHLSIERHVPGADPIKLEMEKVGYIPAAPSNAIGGVRLTPEQYDKYQATAGPLVHEALNEIVNSPGWKDLPAGERRQDLEQAVKSMRAMAAQTIQMDYPKLIEAGIDRQDKFLETGSRKRATQK